MGLHDGGRLAAAHEPELAVGEGCDALVGVIAGWALIAPAETAVPGVGEHVGAGFGGMGRGEHVGLGVTHPSQRPRGHEAGEGPGLSPRPPAVPRDEDLEGAVRRS